MKTLVRRAFTGVWSASLGALLLASAIPASAQEVGTSRKKIPQDPAAIELNRLLVAAQDAVDKQDYAGAAQNYQDYLAKKPDDAVVHYDLGYAYTAMKRPADAKTEYERAIALDPKMAAAYQNLGVLLIPTDPAAAIAPLQHAAELTPDDARSKWLLVSRWRPPRRTRLPSNNMKLRKNWTRRMLPFAIHWAARF